MYNNEQESNDYFQGIINYQHHFTQPHPSYASQINGEWKTIHRPLKYHVVQDHVEHRRIIGTLGRWYIEYGIIDVDDASIGRVEQIRATLGLHDGNSVIFTSQSRNSYHIYFKPVAGQKLPTIDYYRKAMGWIEQSLGVELYPHPKRVIRLPFGRGQDYLCRGVLRTIDYLEGMTVLSALEEYDLRAHYVADDAIAPTYHFGAIGHGWKAQGLAYWNDGLSDFGTRLEATKRVIYLLWANNIPKESAADMAKKWLKRKHNGYSADYLNNVKKVYKQIEELTEWLYTHFEKRYILPDVPQIIDQGYLTPEAVKQVVQGAQGSLPLLKFALPLAAYVAARGGKEVSVHRHRLAGMSSSQNYLRWLDKLQDNGILRRGVQYSVENYAKRITLDIDRATHSQAMICQKDDAQRPATTLKEWLAAVYTPAEYYQQQQHFGVKRTTILEQIAEIYHGLPGIIIQMKTPNQERIAQYLQQHPTATQAAVAKALGLGLRTVERYWRQVKTRQSVKK